MWLIARLSFVGYIALQCGLAHIVLFFLLEPCAVTYIEVFAAPIVGSVGLFLIVFADHLQVCLFGLLCQFNGDETHPTRTCSFVQTAFLNHEFISSLSAAQLGKEGSWDRSMVTRVIRATLAVWSRVLPTFISRQREVLGMQTAVKMLHHESGGDGRTTCVLCAVP